MFTEIGSWPRHPNFNVQLPLLLFRGLALEQHLQRLSFSRKRVLWWDSKINPYRWLILERGRNDSIWIVNRKPSLTSYEHSRTCMLPLFVGFICIELIWVTVMGEIGVPQAFYFASDGCCRHLSGFTITLGYLLSASVFLTNYKTFFPLFSNTCCEGK